MTNMNFSIGKLALTGAVMFGAMTGLLAPTTASAALVTGQATITMDNTAFSTSSINVGGGYPNGWIVDTFWDSSDNTTGITGSTAPGTVLPTTGSTGDMLFPVNGAAVALPGTSCPGGFGSPCVVNNYPSAGPYGRTEQATTMDASNTSGGGQIGLSGAWLLTSVGGSGVLTPYDFSLTKTAGTWNIRTYDTAFGYQNFLKLTNVSESVNGSGELLLSGDLQWTGLWAGLVGANQSTVVGHFNLAPVPVPAAVWLFGSALAGLIGVGRRKAALAA